MAKGQRLKPEQIVTLLRQIDVLLIPPHSLSRPMKIDVYQVRNIEVNEALANGQRVLQKN